MQKYSLNNQWQMKKKNDDKIFTTNVPTTMYKVLYENNVIGDPFYGENDKMITNLSDDDYIFYTSFQVDKEMNECEFIELEFLGLDTLATISLNNNKIGKTNNMHRVYTFMVKEYIKEGLNELKVEFESPTKFIEREQAKDPLWGIETTMDGYEHLRKAHHMFGWDWGPQMPDMGIWRDVNLITYSEGKIDSFYVTQNHQTDNSGKLSSVLLDLEVETLIYESGLEMQVELIDNNNECVSSAKADAIAKTEFTLSVDNPHLWWPNGYGDQYLYQLKIQLVQGDKVIDQSIKKIGLRTVTMHREKDNYGESFDLKVNGYRLFAMGADYIPEDALITRPTEQSTRQLISDCARANYNCLRVWGGGYYPNDTFFDLCDEYGLIVWQDFMFACGVYRLTQSFEDNITNEFIDNIKRIRHHACLGLWCGNNEMEEAFVSWGLPKDERLRMDYLLMYEKLIPDILNEYDPNTFYWPASPSSGGGFDNPNGDDKGDVHYWRIFHGNEHYKKFREHYFRFASEYGMQAFPDYKTVQSYSEKKEQNIFSPVMENHNKCISSPNGNIKILLNMAGEFQLPKETEEIIYLSQVFQGETIKCAVEHFRRHRGRCMGSTYWQVNDNYPVASWSSIDYYGRWKGMHYMAKRFYAPVLLSAYEDVHIDHLRMESSKAKAYIHVTNEQLDRFIGSVRYVVRHIDGRVLEERKSDVSIEKLSATQVFEIDVMPFVSEYMDIREIYISYELFDNNDQRISMDTLLLTYHKHFRFKDTKLTGQVIEADGDKYVEIMASEYSKSIAISFDNIDVVLEDNFFDMLPEEMRRIKMVDFRNQKEVSIDDLNRQLKVMSVNTLKY